jgi:hypothetical protein
MGIDLTGRLPILFLFEFIGIIAADLLPQGKTREQ